MDIHYEWTQFPLWLNGRYGIDSIAGHEIGLNSELVRDLLAWSDAADAQFEADDPANSAAPDNFLEDGFELASGGLLDGDLILEVPVQDKGISKDLFEYAASKEPPIIIRDVQGKIYEFMVE